MTGIPEKTDGTVMFPNQGADVMLQSRGRIYENPYSLPFS